MIDYISRDAALETVREKLLICDALPDTIVNDASLFTLASMQHSLESIPAANVREVVLCRDCRDQQVCRLAQYLGLDGFCSNGERQTNGAEIRHEPPKEEET